jgi:inhibitor of KinA sporulation pathway (predicted exonuclease)|tara:strand:- start:1040 stop:1396 length:357 start_codon:yes stop_codon:yes gene_type:complete
MSPDMDAETMIQALMEDGVPSPIEEPIAPIQDKYHEPYSNMTVNQLKAQLESRGLPITGNKGKLVKRLQDGEDTHPLISVKVDTKGSEDLDSVPVVASDRGIIPGEVVQINRGEDVVK